VIKAARHKAQEHQCNDPGETAGAARHRIVLGLVGSLARARSGAARARVVHAGAGEPHSAAHAARPDRHMRAAHAEAGRYATLAQVERNAGRDLHAKKEAKAHVTHGNAHAL
jgi:hypothetical protein